MHITPNNRLASLGTIGLLFLAGIAGMVFLLPASPVHAATPTVTLSTITSGVLTATTTGTVGSTIVVTGSGFNPASPITITTVVGTTTVPWLTKGACTTANGGASSTTPAVDSLVVAGCLTTTAVGNFAVEVNVPNLPGGAQTISVSDSVNTGTATYTVKSAVTVTFAAANFGFPEEGVSPSIAVSGFGSGESVTVSTPMFTTTSFTCTTGTTIGTYGAGTCGAGTVVADQNGGSKTITATGATSGDTATTTYTVNPWASFYNSNAHVTTFSFIGTAPTSIIIEAHGLAAAAISANTITIGGVVANHAAVTPGTTGAVYALVASPSANVPYGVVSVVIGGVTFNWASGNIALGAITSGVVVTVGSNAPWGGALISSVIGGATTTGVASVSASTFSPGSTTVSLTNPAPQTSQIGFFGYGFVPSGAAGGVLTIATPAGAAYSTAVAYTAGNGGVGGANGAGKPDANGAFYATAVLGDTPWSSAASPTVAAQYAPTVTQAATAPANILSPTFGIKAWVSAPTAATVDYTTSTEAITGHGFSATEGITLTIGSTAMVSGGTCTTTAFGTCTTVAGQVPDIAGGAQNIAVSGALSGVSVPVSGAITYSPMIGLTAAGQALSINSGGAGQTSVLRTGVGYGVHGLLGNTAYNIIWNAIGSSTTVGTFTSTATGGVPIPGTQFTVPSDSSGIHIVDIQTAAGSSAVFGSLVSGQFAPTEAPFSTTYTTAFGDLLFSNKALLQAAPSVAVIGAPESLSGTGLTAAGSYVVALGCNNAVAPCGGVGTVLTNAPALATFIATSSGSVPSGTSITLTDTASTLETGTVEYFSIQTAAHYGVSTASDAFAEFVLAASANLNMTSAPNGHPVTVTAHALNSGAVYNIVFNYVQSAFNSLSYTGTTVGVIAPNAVGAGSATFNVPANAAATSTQIQLVVTTQGAGGAPVGTAVLDTPLTLSVGSVSTGSCNTTACMTVSGTPTKTTQGVYNGISSVFTNNSNAPVTAFVYAVVHNALGQTIDISTATVTAPSGGSASAFNVLFGLPPGTYSVSLFVTSSAGTAISSSTTVSVTI